MVKTDIGPLRMHQPYYPDLVLPGKNLYADRALLLPGTAVVSSGDEDFSAYLNYLRETAEIGAKEVVQIPGEDIYASFFEREEIVECLRGILSSGSKLEFFNSSLPGERLLNKLGLHWRDTLSPPPGVAGYFDNKVYLRTISGELRCGQVFPPHVVCASERRVNLDIEILETKARNKYGQKCDFLILKRPDLASGKGMIRLRTDSPELLRAQLRAYFDKYGEDQPCLLEAGYEHVPVSILWNIGEVDASVLAVTRQILNERFEHEGNIISSGPIAGISSHDREMMIAKTAPFIWAMQGRGYRGVCGFDLMRTKTGMIFVLECNARFTASAYAAGVGAQIGDSWGNSPWTIYMRNIYPQKIRSFRTLSQVLAAKQDSGSVLFDEWNDGALPFNVRCLGLPEPKCGLMCISETEDGAKKLFEEAERRIKNYQPPEDSKTP